MRQVLSGLVIALAAGVLLGATYLAAFRAALDTVERTGQVQLDQATDRLLGQLEPYQQLPNLLSRHPTVTGLLTGAVPVAQANEFLANTALTVGADAILVLDKFGQVRAASDFESPNSSIGKVLSTEQHVWAALSGSLGVEHGIDTATGARLFYVARGAIDGAAPPQGVVLVQVDAAGLEFEWQGDDAALTFKDEANLVFVTNRLEMQLLDGASLTGRDWPALFGGLRTMPPSTPLPQPSLILSQIVPRLNMTASIYLDPSQAFATARLTTYLTAALLALSAAAYWAFAQRRRRLTDRLEAEAEANAMLEARVENRTQQLRNAQEQLVQASKLTALGQMSAGISHELTQPLSAIRNFAENGVKLLDRDRAPDARKNLTQIADQSDRINRILRNLRAFARNEPEAAVPIDACAAVSDAMRLVEPRAKAEGILLTSSGERGPVMAMGGQVRLQQVLVNLISNAMDAVAEAEEKSVQIEVHVSDKVFLTVHDTGPGITEPDRVFEPFYTTKEVGASKGLGLGLAISYGIIGSFGGELSCRNTDKGAAFSITLQRAEQ
ncbi:MAG: ATP-binding protein [Pseudomonadota bacterium]